MNLKDIAVAEGQVIIRVLLIALVPKVAMFVASGDVMALDTYLTIAGVLFVVANGVFGFFKLLDDGTIEKAIALENSLHPGESDE